MFKLIIAGLLSLALQAHAGSQVGDYGDYLVKLKNSSTSEQLRLTETLPEGSQVESIGLPNWVRVQIPQSGLQSINVQKLSAVKNVSHVEVNGRIKMLESPSLMEIQKLAKDLGFQPQSECEAPESCADVTATDNPDIPDAKTPGAGDNPLLDKQWGVVDVGAPAAWNMNKGRKEVVVAVIDTGVDYTHEDLVENLWRNPGEHGTDAEGKDKATNGKDDDGNGYIDDVIGWDFVTNDNKPYDLSVSQFELLTGGNPGHGTHCAGNVAARGFNGKGISGVAPFVSIMSIRFLSEKGQGTTEGAIKSIMYAVDNGADIMSNSWGSEGEDEGDTEAKALREAVAYAESKGVLFVGAAGNGHSGKGYDNDTDPKPAYPASYDHDIIISVAAIDASDALGSFSNWGAKSVDIAAPGVKVFSTTTDAKKYSDTVLDLFGLVATWDGTSMATPHVAGAAALYLSQNPTATWREIKDAILKSAKPIPSMNGKSVSGGKLSVEALMKM